MLQNTATHCNTLQHSGICCSVLQCVHAYGCGLVYIEMTKSDCNTLQHGVLCCSVLQCVHAYGCGFVYLEMTGIILSDCNTLQHAATRSNTVCCVAVCCSLRSDLYLDNLVGSIQTTHLVRLQHTATHCNTLQHTATQCVLQCVGDNPTTHLVRLTGLTPMSTSESL